jgi:glyoxylase-like metal-dependent hydrolase (beta-lactamase superfamily II)
MLALLPAALGAQVNFDTVQVRSQQLRGGVYVLFGAGGNIGLSVGDDAAFIVDDQFAPLTPKIVAAIAAITNKPIRFVVNTHWHGDHSGGNESFARAGSIVVAHNNVRKRMSAEQFNDLYDFRTPASPPGALPVVSFSDSITFHINGDDVVAFHVPPAHTDGDAIIYFSKADIVHMGDTFFYNTYPFIDTSTGGHVNGIIAAADRVLAMCTPRTIVVPGHGPVATCGDLRTYRNVVATIRDRVRAEMQRGRTLDQIKAAGVSKDFDAAWGKGFVPPDRFIDLVHRSLVSR